MHALIAFFEARRGKLHGFRFHDAFDFKSCAPSATPGPGDQAIGAGDGASATFQLRKAYGDYLRPIAKPVEGSVRIAVAGGELDPEDFAIDATTGVVTLLAPPAEGAAVTAGFRFDTPVRFDIDRLDLSMAGAGAACAIAVPVMEILI
jgi:uncharacterized protein (TIGR02217 family)